MAEMLETGWIDVSVLLRDGMVVWPGDPEVNIERVQRLEHGDSSNLTQISMSAHTGTHMDALAHFIPGAAGIDSMPLSATIGKAHVIEIDDPVSITAAEIAKHEVSRGDRVLFRTRNSRHPWDRAPFLEDFVYLSANGAQWLAERGVRTVGIDYLSVGGFRADGVAAHCALLQAGIWIIEGLDLAPVCSGWYELICLPLKIANADGAPARALLRPI